MPQVSCSYLQRETETPFTPQNIPLEQNCYERSQAIDVTSLCCLLFSTSKNKDLKLIAKSATNAVVALNLFLDLKVCFSPRKEMKDND